MILLLLSVTICVRYTITIQIYNSVFWFILGGLLHEISNEGAKTQFEKFLDNRILPEMVKAAKVFIIYNLLNFT